MDRFPGVGETECEHVALRLHSSEDHPDLTEIDLGLRPGRMQLRDEDLRDPAGLDEDLSSALGDIVADRSIRDIRVVLVEQAGMHPSNGHPLLLGRRQILAQPVIDQRLERLQLRSSPLRDLPLWRDRGRQRLTDRAPMHPEPFRQRVHRQTLDPRCAPDL